ncbi:MAG: 6-bladed beta-propeller [Candidatus Paceibacterota bacterium]
MRNLLISLIVIICITFSCKDKSECEIIDINLLKNESIVDLHQYSDSLRVIKLETTEESLINRIDRIIQDDSILILLDKPNKSVLVFHSSGQFYHTIKHWGKGNGEYIAIQAIAVDKERDVIYVFDDNLRKLISYDYKGGFLSEKYLPEYLMRSFAKRKNGNFLAFTPDIIHPLRDGVWEFDSEGNLIREYADVDSNHKLAWGTHPYFTNINEKYSYLNYYDNYIYTLDEDKFERILNVHIKQKIPDKYLPIPDGVDETFTGEYYMPSSLNETHNFFHFANYSSVSKPSNIHVFIEKKSNKLLIAGSLKYDFEDYRNIVEIFSNDGKNLFGVLESSTSNNPALVVFNLKSFQ